MFGNLVNNRQFLNLVKLKVIEIEPFKKSDLSTVHYTLHVNKIKKKREDGRIHTEYDFDENDNPYSIKAGEYVIVEILEKVKLNDENIVGKFIPASNLIEDGLLLIAGKIDKKYWTTGSLNGRSFEMINFGLCNVSNTDLLLKKNYRIAHLELFDLRGVSSEKVELSEEEIKQRVMRMFRAYDDGVYYGDGNS